MSFFEAVVDTHTLYETSGHLTILKSNEMDIPGACFPTRLALPGWRMNGRGVGKEGGSDAGRRKEERSTPRYSINRGPSARPCMTREECLGTYLIINMIVNI